MAASDRERVSSDDGAGTLDRTNSLETAIRGDETVVRCPYCDRPFHEPRLRTLHCGLEHPARLSDDEQEAFEGAYLEEGTAIRRFRLYALGTLIVLYFVMLFLYAVVT